MPEGILARFRIFCTRERKHYYVVYIFQTQKLMYAFDKAFCQHVGLCVNKQNYEAIVHSYRKFDTRGKKMKHKDIGLILFHTRAIGGGLVSHELCHAAVYWMGQVHPRALANIQHSRAADERLAYVQGYLVSQFWKTFFRKKLDQACACGAKR